MYCCCAISSAITSSCFNFPFEGNNALWQLLSHIRLVRGYLHTFSHISATALRSRQTLVGGMTNSYSKKTLLLFFLNGRKNGRFQYVIHVFYTCVIHHIEGKWPYADNHTLQKVSYLHNGAVSQNILSFVAHWVRGIVFRLNRCSRGEFCINEQTDRQTDRPDYHNLDQLMKGTEVLTFGAVAMYTFRRNAQPASWLTGCWLINWQSGRLTQML